MFTAYEPLDKSVISCVVSPLLQRYAVGVKPETVISISPLSTPQSGFVKLDVITGNSGWVIVIIESD